MRPAERISSRHGYRVQFRNWHGSWRTYRRPTLLLEEAERWFFELKQGYPLVRVVHDGLTVRNWDASREEERAS